MGINDQQRLASVVQLSELKGAVRGKYAARHCELINVVRPDDVAEAFSSEGAVKEALRLLLKLAKQQVNQPQH